MQSAGTAATTKPGIADGERSPELAGDRHPLYRLCHSDVIEVTFTFSPEYNQTAKLQPDGFVALKGIAPLYAEGKTVPEVRNEIGGAYASFLHEPDITVTLKEFDTPHFIASGEVSRPGKYELHGDTTVSEAVAIAGGFTAQAKHSQVVLFRRDSHATMQALVLNVKQMLKSRDLGEDLQVQAGDLLYVPQNVISKVRRYLPPPSLGLYWNAAQF